MPSSIGAERTALLAKATCGEKSKELVWQAEELDRRVHTEPLERPSQLIATSAKKTEEAAKQAASEYPPEYYQRDPARADLVTAHRQANNPLDIAHKINLSTVQNDGFQCVRGLKVNLKTRDANDKVLVIATIPSSMSGSSDGVSWSLKRGNYYIGSQHHCWVREIGRLDHILVPWLDEPGAKGLDVEYSVAYRLKGDAKISGQEERRQLTTICIPGGQVTSVRSHEPLAVTPGRWHDVPGLRQVSVTGAGEKVLVVCSIAYTALWSDELTRGRFTITRNGSQLDRESFGLQSVRALQKGANRTLVMALVDDPEPGPQLYAVKAAVTTESDESRVCHIDNEDRQLTLIRLPAALVNGPCRCEGPTLVEEDRWTPIAGLSVTTTVENSSEKVLVTYNANLNPTELMYESYFTVFRSNSNGNLQNLGGDSQGMWSVSSSSAGSSEYPVGMFVDVPGAGTYTYSLYARSRRCENLTLATPVEVGPDGQIATVRLPSGSAAKTQNDHGAVFGVLEQMASEMKL